MSRDNSSRVSAPNLDLAPPKKQGDSFNFTLPSTFVDLPSKGKYYEEDHPLHNVESVEIKYMTAKEEDILSSISLLQKGVAVDRMLQSLLVDKTIKPNEMLIGDKNALMVAARITGFGEEYRANVTCPACSNRAEYAFDLSKTKNVSIDDLDISEVEKTEQNTFVFNLPVSKVRTEVRLLDGRDEQYLTRLNNSKKDNNLPETPLTDRLKIIIASINGSTIRGDVEKFVDQMPVLDSRYLRAMYTKIVPNIDLTQDFICTNCNHRAAMEVPLTADFFWPRL